MTAVQFFPPLNASLNALSGVFLLTAYYFIRRKNIPYCATWDLNLSTRGLVEAISTAALVDGVWPSRPLSWMPR